MICRCKKKRRREAALFVCSNADVLTLTLFDSHNNKNHQQRANNHP
ncbi:unknown protein [Cronobacter turicensis z3032]|uniref:Uncharacterized protein n=1 Tax=Cronobacter turicensis (strain DSM 18703 / CCUG 55852 / LMG 23827 / z3032) TaxID=693216 RepID=C9Y547_CROTZ|nr:unknown protein [Cronobacter turicensis z3032]